VDDLLSADAINSDIIDTKELYVDYIKPKVANTIIIQGNLVIEDPDEEPVKKVSQSISSFVQVKS
jgi:hypothetical protein